VSDLPHPDTDTVDALAHAIATFSQGDDLPPKDYFDEMPAATQHTIREQALRLAQAAHHPSGKVWLAWAMAMAGDDVGSQAFVFDLQERLRQSEGSIA
jgi:hypothetical protein